MKRKEKGNRAERELVNLLWASGFAATRVPASGSGRREPLPDVIASNGSKIVGLELKSISGDTAYIPIQEVEKLKEFCDNFGCEPLLGIRFDRKGWLFAYPKSCQKTENNYKVPIEMAKWRLVKGEGLSLSRNPN